MSNPARSVWINSWVGRIHDGLAFVVDHQKSALVGGATITYLIRVQDKECHLQQYMVSATQSPHRVELRDGVTASNVGTLITPYNRRRSRARTCESALFYHSATLSNTGTLIESSRVIGDKQAGNSFGVAEGEWILKPNTDYAVRVINEANAAADVIFRASIYEDD